MMYTGLVPPDTIRMCPTCKKNTIWGYQPVSGHSRCRTCGCNQHTGSLHTITIEDYEPKQPIEITNTEIHKLRCENGQLKKRVIEQRKHLNGLNEKLRRKEIE